MLVFVTSYCVPFSRPASIATLHRFLDIICQRLSGTVHDFILCRLGVIVPSMCVFRLVYKRWFVDLRLSYLNRKQTNMTFLSQQMDLY